MHDQIVDRFSALKKLKKLENVNQVLEEEKP